MSRRPTVLCPWWSVFCPNGLRSPPVLHVRFSISGGYSHSFSAISATHCPKLGSTLLAADVCAASLYLKAAWVDLVRTEYSQLAFFVPTTLGPSFMAVSTCNAASPPLYPICPKPRSDLIQTFLASSLHAGTADVGCVVALAFRLKTGRCDTPLQKKGLHRCPK